jgi:hypothetical protein
VGVFERDAHFEAKHCLGLCFWGFGGEEGVFGGRRSGKCCYGKEMEEVW